MISNVTCRSSLHKIICPNRLDAGSISATLAQHRNVSCAYDLSCYYYPWVVLLKSRIVRIIFSCTLPHADNCYPTTFYRNLHFMSLLINVSGVLRRHCTVESFYDWNLWFLLWCLYLFLPLYGCFFLFRVNDHILQCDILWMYLFLPYCVRKWHDKTVQSLILMIWSNLLLQKLALQFYNWHQGPLLLTWVSLHPGMDMPSFSL